MKLSHKLYLGFALVIVLAVIQGALSLNSMRTLRRNAVYLADEYSPEVILAGNMRMEIAMAGYHMRAYFATLDPKDYQAGVERLNNLQALLGQIRELNAQQTQLPELPGLLDRVEPAVKTYNEMCTAIDRLATINARAREDVTRALSQLSAAADTLLATFNEDLAREDAAYKSKVTAQTADQVIRRYQRLRAVDAIKLRSFQLAERLWQALLSQDNAAVGELVQDARDLVETLQAFRQDSRQQKNIPTIQALLEAGQKLEKNFQAIEQANAEMARLGAERLVAFNNVLDQAAQMARAGEQGIEREAANSVREASRDVYSLSICVLLAALMGMAASIWIVRNISTGIAGASQQLEITSSRLDDQVSIISQVSEELSNMATEQASSLEETSAAMEEVTSMSKQNADNVERTNAETSQVVRQIGEGSVAVKNMTDAMTEIDESAEQIGRIIKTIEEIAFQTNLLALNAAVEAARAGEAGKGFAVVADEVRSLAQRSAQAAQETTTLIQGTVERVRHGGEISRRLGEVFQDIETSAQSVGRLVGEITTAITEQRQGIEQVNTAINQIDTVTQHNAGNAEKVRASSRDIEEESEDLLAANANLRRLVHGASASGHSRSLSQPVPPVSPSKVDRKLLPPPGTRL